MRTTRLALLCWATLACGRAPPIEPPPELPQAPCDLALEGTHPFGASLGGTVAVQREDSSKEVEVYVGLELYFPEGRVAGGPVLLVGSSFGGGLVVQKARLAADLTAKLSWHGQPGYRSYSLEGELGRGREGFLVEELQVNLADPGSDVVVDGTGSGRLCPTGSPPAPAWTSPILASPVEEISLQPSVPLGEVSSVRVTAGVGGPDVPITVHLDENRTRVTVAPSQAFPPGTVLQLLVEAHDLIGRALPPPKSVAILGTSAAISDFTLRSRPPDGALNATDPAVRFHVDADGLHLTRDSAGPMSVLMGLPELPDDSTLALRFSNAEYCPDALFELVSPEGTLLRLETADDGSARAMLPAAGRWSLSVRTFQERNKPQWMPAPPCGVVLHGIELE